MANKKAVTKKNSRAPRKKQTPEVAPKAPPKRDQRSFSFRDFLIGRREPIHSQPHPNEPFMRFAPFFSALAIIVALLIAFGLGSIHTGTCKILYKPNIGTFKYLTVNVPKDKDNFFNQLFPPAVKPLDPSKLKQEKNLYLIDAQGQSYQVLYSSNISPTQLDSKTAIVYGAMDSCNHVVSLDTMQNVIIIPVAGPQSSSPQPTPTQ